MRPCRVIGIGNRDRGDDAAGLEVARRLKQAGTAEVVEMDGRIDALLEAFDGVETAYVVDAAMFGGAKGAVLRLDAADGALPTSLDGYSTHGLGLAQGIELARVLKRLPKRCVVFAIQAEGFDQGEGLSPAVATAVAEVERLIQAELAEAA
jgi:hydrogenase maturation protease